MFFLFTVHSHIIVLLMSDMKVLLQWRTTNHSKIAKINELMCSSRKKSLLLVSTWEICLVLGLPCHPSISWTRSYCQQSYISCAPRDPLGSPTDGHTGHPWSKQAVLILFRSRCSSRAWTWQLISVVDCLCSCVLLSLPHCVASRWAARSSTFYSPLGDGCWTSLETKLLLALRHHNESFRPTVTWLLAKLSQGSRNNRPHRYITWPISLCKKKYACQLYH